MSGSNFGKIRDILRFEGRDPRAYWQRFAMLLTLAVVVATMGLLRDSGAVVIAAMLVAPLMSPILGLAAAMVMGHTQRAAKLLGIVLLAASLSVLLAWLLVFVADVPRGILLPAQVLARTDPGIEDLIVALAAGVAGAYVQINRDEISLLPGAAIGVSLVPPLSAAGILLYFGEPSQAYEAVLLFATNLGAIILSASAVYIVTGVRASIRTEGARIMRFSASMAANLIFLAAVIVQLAGSTLTRFHESKLEADLVEQLQAWADPVPVEFRRIQVDPKSLTADIWMIVDLPLGAQYRSGSVFAMLPDHLRENPIRETLRKVLGPGFAVTLRYQTRISAQIIMGTNVLAPAPAAAPMQDETGN